MANPQNSIPAHVADRPHLFWRKVERRSPDECWPWRAYVAPPPRGYGIVFRATRGGVVRLMAHRVAWFLHHGTDPVGRYVRQRCGNRLCCNPAHLYLGAASDTDADKLAMGSRIKARRDARERGFKLNAGQVREIRERYVPRKVTHKMLAAEYGVSASLIERIVNRRLRANV